MNFNKFHCYRSPWKHYGSACLTQPKCSGQYLLNMFPVTYHVCYVTRTRIIFSWNFHFNFFCALYTYTYTYYEYIFNSSSTYPSRDVIHIFTYWKKKNYAKAHNIMPEYYVDCRVNTYTNIRLYFVALTLLCFALHINKDLLINEIYEHLYKYKNFLIIY